MRYWRAFIVMFLSAVGFAAAAAPADTGIVRTPDRLNAVLATVNGEPISLGDVLPLTQAREYQAAAAYSGEMLTKAVYKLRLEAVDELIDSKLILADYAGKKFEISPRDIEAALDEVSTRMGCRSRVELARRLRESGTTIEELRKKLREQLIVQLMLQREYHVSNFITPADIYRYYQEHEAEFARPESIELAMLQLPVGRSDSEKAIREISDSLAADPGNFADLVRRYSSGPGRNDGGILGLIERRRLRAEFAAALGSAPIPGSICGPLRTADGVFWLKVIAFHPAEKVSFGDSGANIRRRMEADLRRESRARYCARLRKGAIVRYFIPGAPSEAGEDGSDSKNDINKTAK